MLPQEIFVELDAWRSLLQGVIFRLYVSFVLRLLANRISLVPTCTLDLCEVIITDSITLCTYWESNPGHLELPVGCMLCMHALCAVT